MEGPRAKRDLARDCRVMGDDRGHQRAFAPVDERNGMIQVAVAHDGRNRTEGFGVVHPAAPSGSAQ